MRRTLTGGNALSQPVLTAQVARSLGVPRIDVKFRPNSEKFNSP